MDIRTPIFNVLIFLGIVAFIPRGGGIQAQEFESGVQQTRMIGSVEMALVRQQMRVVFLRDQRFPLVTIEFHVYGAGLEGTGTDYDEIAARVFVQSLMDELDDPDSPRVRMLRRLGARVSVASRVGSSGLTIEGTVLDSHVRELIEILTQMVRHPVFKSRSVEPILDQKMARQPRRQSSPFYQALQAVLGSSTIDLQQPDRRQEFSMSVSAWISRVREWHRREVAPENIVVAATGRVTLGEILSELTRRVSGWKKRRGFENHIALDYQPDLNPSSRRSACGVELIPTTQASEVVVVLASNTVKRTHKDFPILAVLNLVLGGGPGSRLHRELRLKLGSSYQFGSFLDDSRDPAPFIVHATFDHTKAVESARILFEEILEIRSSDISDSELQHSKTALVSRNAMQWEEPHRLLNRIVLYGKEGSSFDGWRRSVPNFGEITVPVVRHVAQKYLSPDHLLLVVAGHPKGASSVIEEVISMSMTPDRRLLSDDCFDSITTIGSSDRKHSEAGAQ